jgi:hypothetical protein
MDSVNLMDKITDKYNFSKEFPFSNNGNLNLLENLNF